MESSGSLFLTALSISLKESGRRLLWAAGALVLCGGLLWLCFPQKESVPFSIRVGIVNQDHHVLGESLQQALLENTGVVQLESLSPEMWADSASAYTAVLHVPTGFTESVMAGENHLPLTLHLNKATPLEALWAEQMLQQGLAALELGQQAVGAVALLTENGVAMDPLAYGRLLLSLNSHLLSAFAGGQGMMLRQQLLLTGDYTLGQYAVTSLFVTMSMCMGFLFAPAISATTAFPLRRFTVQGAGLLHTVLLCQGLCLGFCVLLYGQAFALSSLLGAGCVLGGWIWLVCRIFGKTVFSGPAGLALALVQALLGGGLLPLPLLPPIMSIIAKCTPFYWIMALLRPL